MHSDHIHEPDLIERVITHQSEEERMKKASKIFLCLWVFAVFAFGFNFAQSEVKKIPQRSEIADQYKWRVEDIYPADSEWEKDFAKVELLLPEMEKFKGQLEESGRNLLDCLVMQDSIQNILDRVYVYAHLKLDEDSRISKYQELSDRSAGLRTKVSQAFSFIDPEILSIPQDRLEDLVEKEMGLSLYAHYIDNITRKRAHTLSAAEEALLAGAGDIARIPRTLFKMIENADLKFPSIKDEEGNEVELTHQRYYKFLQSTNRRVRKDASDAYNQAYLPYLNTLGANLAGSINKDMFYARTRKYSSSLEAALQEDNIPTEVFNNLMKNGECQPQAHSQICEPPEKSTAAGRAAQVRYVGSYGA